MNKFELYDVVVFDAEPHKIMRILDMDTLHLFNTDNSGISKIEDCFRVTLFGIVRCTLCGVKLYDLWSKKEREDLNRKMLEISEGRG